MTGAQARPRVSFVVGGVQKGGTTAMAHCLSAHPGVILPVGKEAHVFDAPDFDERATAADVDARYACHFPHGAAEALHGDATPIYCLHERFIERIARYNPAMKWVLLLRHPADRAISQYHMEKARGDESWPLVPALIFERWRLLGHMDDFSPRSPLRHHGYIHRGRYTRQLAALYRHFPPEQVLLIDSHGFRVDPRGNLERVYQHIGLDQPVRLPGQTQVFEGGYSIHGRGHRMARRLASLILAGELHRLRTHYGIHWDRDETAASDR